MPFNIGNIYMVSTTNFLNQISSEMDTKIRGIALKRLGDKGKNQYGETIPDLIIFDPHFNGEIYQDDNRSLKIGENDIPAKVYAKLDDYGSAEALSREVGRPVRTQFVVTFMMTEDY